MRDDGRIICLSGDIRTSFEERMSDLGYKEGSFALQCGWKLKGAKDFS